MKSEQCFAVLRKKMVEEQLIPRGIKSAAVLDAMESVPRHLFVPEGLHGYAYDDSPLPIGVGQTISQPYIVAYMTEQLELNSGMKVLEIGTGSGYQTAVLAYLGCEIYTIERHEELAELARKILADYRNVTIKHGDGYEGWPEESPFDAIIVTAAPSSIPKKLFEQLKDGGRMIVPVGEIHSVQSLKVVKKTDGCVVENDLLQVRFVPMVEGGKDFRYG